MTTMNDSLSDPSTAERAGWHTVAVVRQRGGERRAAEDRIVEEWPVALVFNGISHAVMMATPRDLEAFGVGFAISEGIVAAASEIRDIEVEFRDASAEVRLTLLQKAFAELKDKRRTLAGRSGCGICGIESIELLDLEPPPLADELVAIGASITPQALARAARELVPRQNLMRATGGAHAAAWCTLDGEVRYVFEDVGRHNALDKLIGKLAMARESCADGFVFMSSRASYELVRKAARVGIPLLATISAPSSLAISIAQQARLRLLSFCRDDGFVEYEAKSGNAG